MSDHVAIEWNIAVQDQDAYTLKQNEKIIWMQVRLCVSCFLPCSVYKYITPLMRILEEDAVATHM